jgi:hypothetical protein
VWFDEEKMTGDMLQKMSKGIEESAVVGVFITKRYVKKVTKKKDDNCKLEFTHARRHRGASNMIPIVMEEDMNDPILWQGPVGMILGDMLFVNAIGPDIGPVVDKLLTEIENRTDDEDPDSDGSSAGEEVPGFSATDDDGACNTPGCVCKNSDKQPKVLRDGTMQDVLCPYATCRYHQRGYVFATSNSLLSHVRLKHGDDGAGLAANVWLDVGLVYDRNGKLNFRPPSKSRKIAPVSDHDSSPGVITVPPPATPNIASAFAEAAKADSDGNDLDDDDSDGEPDFDTASVDSDDDANWCKEASDEFLNELTCCGAIFCLPALILPCLIVCVCAVLRKLKTFMPWNAAQRAVQKSWSAVMYASGRTFAGSKHPVSQAARRTSRRSCQPGRCPDFLASSQVYTLHVIIFFSLNVSLSKSRTELSTGPTSKRVN